MKRFRFHCVGTTPLLMHNARLSDPLDAIVKQMKPLNSKRAKTEEDHEELARLEFWGGLYFDSVVGPYLPGQNFERCLHEAAKITKDGKKIERGVFIDTELNALEYRGPRTIDGLWQDKNFVHRASSKVGMNRVMRTRPVFRQWQVFSDGLYDPSVINLSELERIAETAGVMIGLGDWRPRYGRFDGTVEEHDG